jgi:hypothetical protein
MGRKKIDRAGLRYGRLLVLREANPRINPGNGELRTQWLCRCDCGVEKTVAGSSLVNGQTRSCGCLAREAAYKVHKTNTKHGDARIGKHAPEHLAWCSMFARCYNHKHPSFHRYGGRGITVCAAWDPRQGGSYENFLRDMGRKPSPKHSIERKDNDDGYYPDNCVWATPIEQGANTSRTVKVVVDGVSTSVRDAARRLGVNPSTARARLVAGRPMDEVLATGKLPNRRGVKVVVNGVVTGIDDAARILGVTPRTARDRISKGRPMDEVFTAGRLPPCPGGRRRR